MHERTIWFSPDGDGRQDDAVVRFSLDQAAHVRVDVRRDGLLMRRHLGRLGAGKHAWRWNGRIDGERAPKGRYVIRLTARDGSASETADVAAVVDRTPVSGHLSITRDSLYPAATTVHDRMFAGFYRDGDARIVVRLTVVDADGDTLKVRTSTNRNQRVPYLFWDARETDGTPVAEGKYTVRARVLDRAGNVSRFHREVQVSHAQLVADHVLRDLTAQEGLDAAPDIGDCLSCGGYCLAMPSDQRFVGGVALGCSQSLISLGFFETQAPFSPAPVDAFRVTASGGPPVSGGGDTATFSGTTLGPGDDTATGRWQKFERPGYATWLVSTDPDAAYDIASFTVEFRHWVPVP